MAIAGPRITGQIQLVQQSTTDLLQNVDLDFSQAVVGQMQCHQVLHQPIPFHAFHGIDDVVVEVQEGHIRPQSCVDVFDVQRLDSVVVEVEDLGLVGDDLWKSGEALVAAVYGDDQLVPTDGAVAHCRIAGWTLADFGFQVQYFESVLNCVVG